MCGMQSLELLKKSKKSQENLMQKLFSNMVPTFPASPATFSPSPFFVHGFNLDKGTKDTTVNGIFSNQFAQLLSIQPRIQYNKNHGMTLTNKRGP